MADDFFAQFAQAGKPAAAPPAAGGGDFFAQFEQAGKPAVEPHEPETPTNDMGFVSAASAAGAAALPAAKWLSEHIATSPMISGAIQRFAPVAGGANLLMEAGNVVSGRKSPLQAAGGAIKGEIMRQGAKLLPRAAGGVANALGAEGVAGMAAPAAVPLAGGLAGVAGTAGFLGALQHDANRHVDIDYQANTPDTDIAKVFMNMRNSEANRGRTLDERMDDPNDVMFKPDDSADVRAAVVAALGR